MIPLNSPVRDTQRYPVAAISAVSGGRSTTKMALTALGIHGQAIYIDPTAEMVIARFVTYLDFIHHAAIADLMSLPAYQAVADYLLTK